MGNPWIIGAALLGVGIIGEWLLGPDKSSTQRPDAMPQMNSAMRGSPIYVTFGANRVYPQLPWSKNYNAVRQQSSGKGGGKGGGSGGMGSLKGGGSAGQQYEYFWDMIFNFGMMDQPSIITQGWIGGDALDNGTVENIHDGFGALSRSYIDYMKSQATAVPNNGTASLKFTSSFYAPGYVTGDPGLETWDYFQTQEDLACQWPSTAWIGFQQLDLGPSPAIPQLSFEFVPQNIGVAQGDGFISRSASSAPGNQGSRYTGRGLLRNTNNRFYACDEAHGGGGAAHRATITDVLTNVQVSVSDTQFYSDTSDSGTWMNTIPVADSPYFYMFSLHGSPTGIAFEIIMYLYQVNTDGTVSYTGKSASYDYGSDFFGIASMNIRAIERVDNGRLMVIFTGSNSSSYETCVQMLPDPAAMLNPTGTYAEQFSNKIALPFHDGSDNLAAVGFCGSTRSNSGQAGIVSGSTDQENWACFYVGIGEINFHIAHAPGDIGYSKYIGDLVATYPHGMMIMAKIITASDGSIGSTDEGVNNAYFTAQDGDPLVPFVDRQKDFDGNPTGSDSDDWFTPSGTGFVIIFRPYSTDTFTFRYDILHNDGATASRDDTHRLFTTLTSDDLGQTTPTIPYVISPTISGAGGMFATVDYVGGAHCPGTAQVSILNTSVDVTPAYIIYRILTSEIFGFQTEALFGYQVTADRIDQNSYDQAVEWCVANGIYVSVTYTNQDNLLNILNELVGLYGGFLTDPGGMITFGVVTGQDIPVRVIDNSHLVSAEGTPPVKISKAALEDGFNRIQFNFLDRALAYNQNQVQVDDEVDQDINTIRVKTYQARFVMNGSVALNIANRALWANLYGKDTYNFTLGWKDADLSQGDLITLVDSFDPTLSGGVRTRITQWKMKGRGQYDCQGVREFPYIITASVDYTQTSTTDGGWGTLVQSVLPMQHQTAYELPQEFQISKAYVYFGYQQASAIMGAQLYLSTDGNNFVFTQDTQPYALSGVFNCALPDRPRGWVEQDAEFFILTKNGFNPSSPTFVQTYNLDNVTEALRAQGAGVLIVGSEAVAYQDLTLIAQNRYRAKRLFRGWGGTPISVHTLGDWFHHHAAGIFQHEIALTDIGNKIWYKIVPYNFAGDLYNVASIDARTYAIRGEYWLPRAMPRVSLFVNSTVSWTNSVAICGPYISVTSGGSDLTMKWNDAAQTEGYGAGGYGANGYGHFADDGTTTGWRIDVASKNGHNVSSFVVNTPIFQYSRAQNSADFAGFGHDLVLKTTPFNVKGDGPTTDIRSISMNW